MFEGAIRDGECVSKSGNQGWLVTCLEIIISGGGLLLLFFGGRLPLCFLFFYFWLPPANPNPHG